MVACSEGVKETMWPRLLSSEIGWIPSKPTIVHCDNMSAINIIRNPVRHPSTKRKRRLLCRSIAASHRGNVRSSINEDYFAAQDGYWIGEDPVVVCQRRMAGGTNRQYTGMRIYWVDSTYVYQTRLLSVRLFNPSAAIRQNAQLNEIISTW